MADNAHTAWVVPVLQAVLTQGGLQFRKANFDGVCFHGRKSTPCKKDLHNNLFSVI
jgi:hypothetical protein